MNLFTIGLEFLRPDKFLIFMADVPAYGSGKVKQAGYAPIDVASAFPVIFWSIVLFGALYFVLDRVILPRVHGAIEHRTQSLEDNNRNARQATDKLDELQKSIESVREEGRAQSKAIIAEARNEGSKIQSEELSNVDNEISEQVTEAESRIAEARDEALSNLSTIAEQTVGEIVSKLEVDVTSKQISEAVATIIARESSK